VNQQLYCRCGCRDENGRQYGKDCPKLKSDPNHGSWGYYLSHGSEPERGAAGNEFPRPEALCRISDAGLRWTSPW
jgi:hypothetical protein